MLVLKSTLSWVWMWFDVGAIPLFFFLWFGFCFFWFCLFVLYFVSSYSTPFAEETLTPWWKYAGLFWYLLLTLRIWISPCASTTLSEEILSYWSIVFLPYDIFYLFFNGNVGHFFSYFLISQISLLTSSFLFGFEFLKNLGRKWSGSIRAPSISYYGLDVKCPP